MFVFGTRLAAPSPLPRSIPPFHGETTSSYLYRLAVANQLHPDDLHTHLTGTRHRPAPVTLVDLAAITGRSAHTLGHALPELRSDTQPGTDPPLPAHVRRTVCHRCAVRRSAFVFAVTWKPAETTLCPKHHIWLGSRDRTYTTRQYDVSELVDIIRAQRRHRRLVQRVDRRIVAAAFEEAAHITELWARRGHHRDRRKPLIEAFSGRYPLTGKLPHGDPITPVVTYPETVDLTYILADFHWRYPRRRRITAREIGQFRRDVSQRLGIRYRDRQAHDPLYRWFLKRHELTHPFSKPTRQSASDSTRRTTPPTISRN